MSEEDPTLKRPALDPETVERRTGSRYPAPFDEPVAARERRALGDALGLENFGVNLLRLPPGCQSSQRHWHTKHDEFVFVVEGELVLLADAGEQVLTAGMAAGFSADSGDGHCLINRTDKDALILEVGDRMEGDEVDYSDIDMQARIIDGVRRYVRNDGTPYE
jgi:uncharacterized cupin superfamily protein